MSSPKLCLSDVAVNDILEQADWYKQRSGPGLAERWEGAVSSAVIRIVKNPQSGPGCTFSTGELKDIRRMRIARFPKHLIFYRVEGGEILILRVVHGARDLESLF